jgi:hypothetical protein
VGVSLFTRIGGIAMYDLIMVSIKQEAPSLPIPNNANIYLEIDQRYWGIWKFMTSADGVWYNLRTDADELGGTKICEHLSWDCGIKLEWVDEEALECVTPYSISPAFFDSYAAILRYLVEQSPVKTVYTLARYQSLDKGIVLGSFIVDEFLDLMKSEKVHANICYIISENKVERPSLGSEWTIPTAKELDRLVGGRLVPSALGKPLNLRKLLAVSEQRYLHDPHLPVKSNQGGPCAT